ncbi:hypothetical protein NBG4_210011 [Candidatus Sulfobium mesophilum]|uniref:Uncharacterized protein n=1 Tax=Candidatus Sulfobium mesophilum TaxID=2016548 RepID=A0A2U3QFZ5_9BACT|nr:hypothetical protein NBG4_210011 [Candidatus Sulfobium mesophilum]
MPEKNNPNNPIFYYIICVLSAGGYDLQSTFVSPYMIYIIKGIGWIG